MVFQKEIASHEKQIVTLGRTLQALRDEATVQGLVRVALDYLQEFNYPLTWLGLYEPDAHRLVGQGGVCPNGEIGLLQQKHALESGDLLEQVVVQQRPLGIPDLRQEANAGEWQRIAKRFNIQGTLIFPVRHQQTCYGAVLLGSLLWGTSPHAEEKARLAIVLAELGEALHRLESDSQRQQVKRPDEAILNLLPKLRSLPSLKKRLEAVIQETHQFVQPDRTSIYWYEPERRYFWKRAGNRVSGFSTVEMPRTETELNAQEVGSFYHALMGDQLITVGEANSHFRADVTGKLMQQLQARSLIAAPILFQNELRGFLAVEGDTARIWTEVEKNLVRAAAQLVALTSPLEEMEEKIQQAKVDQALTAEISRAIYTEEDWKTTLKTTAAQLSQHLRIERFLALVYNKDLKQFEICYQSQPKQRRPLAGNLPTLDAVDWKMLEQGSEAIAVENLEEDLKLMAWRQLFVAAGMRSLLICSTAMGKALEGIIVIGHEAPRSWHQAERELLQTVSQQVGLLLHQFQLQRQTNQLQKTCEAMQSGLSTMQQMPDLERLEQAAVRHIAQVLEGPLTALLTWQPTQTTGKIVTSVVHKQSFGLLPKAEIAIPSDPLVQLALEADDWQVVSIAAISPETREWLCGCDIEQVLVMPLRTLPEFAPTGMLLVGDRSSRTWTQTELSALTTLVEQLAWCRRAQALTQSLLTQRDMLQQLNWYKQRRIEEMYRTLGVGVRRLNELGNQKEAIANMRFPQILRHLGGTLSAVTSLLKHEQWQLHTHHEVLPLASLMKRSLERVDGLVKQRQIWSQVHNEANLSVSGDIPKIEFVLHELLSLACLRSPVSGRIDIWCRQSGDRWLDISITDNGEIDLALIEALQTGRHQDLLAPSILDEPPGLHLTICQTLMERMGGQLSLEKLEDNRTLSRLVLPFKADEPAFRTIIQDD